MINNVILVGRITKDLELKNTTNGTPVTSFSLAVNRDNDKNSADFISCVAWNKTAENLVRYCSKGSLIAVVGSIQTRNYENKQGQKVYVTEVNCNRVQFLETKKNEQPKTTENNRSQPKGYEQTYGNFTDDDFSSFDINDDDINF